MKIIYKIIISALRFINKIPKFFVNKVDRLIKGLEQPLNDSPNKPIVIYNKKINKMSIIFNITENLDESIDKFSPIYAADKYIKFPIKNILSLLAPGKFNCYITLSMSQDDDGYKFSLNKSQLLRNLEKFEELNMVAFLERLEIYTPEDLLQIIFNITNVQEKDQEKFVIDLNNLYKKL